MTEQGQVFWSKCQTRNHEPREKYQAANIISFTEQNIKRYLSDHENENTARTPRRNAKTSRTRLQKGVFAGQGTRKKNRENFMALFKLHFEQSLTPEHDSILQYANSVKDISSLT